MMRVAFDQSSWWQFATTWHWQTLDGRQRQYGDWNRQVEP
jgi:hypothetical protein